MIPQPDTVFQIVGASDQEVVVQKLRGLSLIVILIALVGCVGPGSQPTPEETTLTQVGQVAPPFQLETLGGEVFSLEEQQGKVVLVNFFATWCPPCKEELPHLEKEIWQRFQGRELAVLVVGREHTNDEIAPFMEEFGYTFPVAGDPERTAYGQYASQYIPRNVVVGPDGTILFQSSGFEKEEFDQMIELIETTLEEIASAAEAETTDSEEAVAAE
jgi:peroxiredoxin